MTIETQERTPVQEREEREPFPVSADGGQAITFGSFLQVLQHGKRTILAAGLGTLLLAAVIAFVLPPTYVSTASFVPPGSNSGGSSAAALMGQLSEFSAGGLLGSKSQGDLYVGILKSHTIGRDLVQRFNLISVYKVKKESQAEQILGSNSSFESGMKDPIVTISVVDHSPERARDLADGYLQALQTTTASLALTESSQRRLFYEQRLAKEKDELANAEVALKQAQEKSGLIAPAGQTSSEIQTLAELQAQITDRQVRVAALLHDETEQNSDVLRLRSEIASLQGQLSHLENGQNHGQFGHFSTAQVPALELEYIRRTRDVKYHEALFDIIAKQYEAARLDEAKDSPLQVLDRAMIPDTKSGPHRTVIMAIGLLVGLAGGCVWVLAKSLRAAAPLES